MLNLSDNLGKDFIEKTLFAQMLALEEEQSGQTPDTVTYQTTDYTGEMALEWPSRHVHLYMSVNEFGYNLFAQDSLVRGKDKKTYSYNAQPAAVFKMGDRLIIRRCPENGYAPCGPWYAEYEIESNHCTHQRWFRHWDPSWVANNPKSLWDLAYSLSISGYPSWVDGGIVRSLGNPLEYSIQIKDLKYSMNKHRYTQLMIEAGVLVVPHGSSFLVFV